MSRRRSSTAAKRRGRFDALGALLFAILLSLYAALVDATSAPQSWLDQSIQGVDEHLHPVIEGHIRSQLDWRSYYLDRPTTQRRQGPFAGEFDGAMPRHASDVSSPSLAGES